jgi:hypothetical protein
MKAKIFRSLLGMILVIPLIYSSMSAQKRAEFKFIVGDETGTEVNLIAGVDSRATDSVDLVLGEQETPGHPGFFIGIVSAGIKINNSPFFSYKSYRRLPLLDTFMLEYVINVNSFEFRGIPFFFKWSYPLPRGIDSAVIEDPFGGDLYSISIDKKLKSIPITNEGLNNYSLKIWYSKVPLDVFEKEEVESVIKISANWRDEYMIIEAPLWHQLEVINLVGITVWRCNESSNKTVLNTSIIPNGLYFIKATSTDGSILTKKIILAR